MIWCASSQSNSETLALHKITIKCLDARASVDLQEKVTMIASNQFGVHFQGLLERSGQRLGSAKSS